MAKKMQITLPKETQEQKRSEEELFFKIKTYAKLVRADIKSSGIRVMNLKLEFLKNTPPTYEINGISRDYAIAEMEAAIEGYTDAILIKK